MLSRLIVTFLCAAAIGSVSGVFLTFDPKPIEFEDIEGRLILRKTLPFNSELLARKVTVSSLSADIPTTDTLKVRRRDPPPHTCFIKSDKAETFDKIPFSFNKPGWYNMAFTRDIKVQVFRDKCTAELSCIKKVLARYGSSVVSLDVSGPAKSLREYSVTEVTQNTNGLRYSPAPMAMSTKLFFHMDRNFISRWLTMAAS
ncbi:hypothetical protein BASA62_002623 [Batrachochytrium salamandrivorans]|nr:hypothetical protein BASA62_002623 [Batrachochytrium salamandrivorans]